MKCRILSLLILICLMPTRSYAVDSQGGFALKGAGMLPCKIYLAERERRSEVYYLIAGWVDGYVSAYNQLQPSTFDVLSFETLELLLKVVDANCQKNPDVILYKVVTSLVKKVEENKLAEASTRQTIQDGVRKTTLYTATIKQMQTKLAALKFYNGAVDGLFSQSLKKAIAAYQAQQGFEDTGFPDQATLWQLLRKP